MQKATLLIEDAPQASCYTGQSIYFQLNIGKEFAGVAMIAVLLFFLAYGVKQISK